jgi:HAD superfamily hydrolase (TIGR01484 family)
MLPLHRLSRRALVGCPALLSDVDGTLTTHNELESATVRALEQVRDAGVPVILVTGRPAGYAELLTRYLPVRGAIAENGGLWFLRDAAGAIHKHYAEPAGQRHRHRARLVREVEAILARFPGARLSTDSAYTEVDLAIDYAEQSHLSVDTARAIERACRARKLSAVRSSVHVNVWASGFDKRHTSLRVLREALGLTAAAARASVIYLGDSFNDAPMFAAFELSIGVAQVRELGAELRHRPKFIASQREGAGAREALQALSRSRRRV